jgi:hypothetical protein
MNPKICILVAAACLLVAAVMTARAAAGDPPPSSLDLGAAKPRSDASSVLNPGGILPVGQSQLLKPKTTTDTSATGSPGIGTAVKSPLGTKGVLGSPVSGAKSTQDDTASSNDVVVKLPSNMKK